MRPGARVRARQATCCGVNRRDLGGAALAGAAAGSNVVCFGALDLIGDLLVGVARRGICFLAVGSGDPAWEGALPGPDPTRTALTAEVARVPLRIGQELTYDQVAGAVDVRVDLPAGVATGVLRELGLFGGAASAVPGSGTLLNHKAHDRIDKGADDVVRRELRLELSAALPGGARTLIGGLLAGTPGLSGLTVAAIGSDGSTPAQPPPGLLAETYRVSLGGGELRHDRDRHEVTATLRVPFGAGPELAAEAGLFGGTATPAPGSGLLVQRQTFDPVDRRTPRALVRRFTLSLVSAAAVNVPRVIGESASAARAALAAAGLMPGEQTLVDGAGAAAGTVVAQHPGAGESVPEASRVKLEVAAAATIAVPDVLGLALASAQAALTAAGLVPGDPTLVETTEPRGHVVRTVPVAGARVLPGTTIALSVATPPVRAVPDLLGRTPAAAAVLLEAAGFRLADPPYPVKDSGSTAGTVIAQAPTGRTQAAVDLPVQVTLATPWTAVVPDLSGLSPAVAAARLREAAAPVLAGLDRPPDPPGLALGPITDRPAATGEQPGTVVEQTPAAAARVALYAAVAVVIAGSARQPVPDLTGLSLAAATAALSSAGFAVGAVAHRAGEAAIGLVVGQDPDPGSVWPAGGRVAVSVTVPVQVAVPGLVGLDQAAATEGLVSRGLVAGTVTAVQWPPGPPAGQVVQQAPAADVFVDKGTAVALTVVQGLPNLVGRTMDDALAVLNSLGLTVVRADQPSDQPPGVVVGQQPAAGTATQPGEVVTLNVAIPRPIPVPDVTGQPFPVAQQQFAALGLTLVVAGSIETGDLSPGSVVSLQPAAGTLVPPGSTVQAMLAVAPPVVVMVPGLGGMTSGVARQACAAVQLVLVVNGSRPAPGHAADTVLDEDPPAGTRVLAGSTVGVVVASVDTSVLVPDLRSLPLGQAVQLAQAVGLGVANVGSALFLGDGGIVLTQDPIGNSRVPAGATVNVTVSIAAIQLPDLVGDDVTLASEQLRRSGMVVQLVVRRVIEGDGSVIAQRPAAGTVLARGETVVLTYTAPLGRPPGSPPTSPKGPIVIGRFPQEPLTQQPRRIELDRGRLPLPLPEQPQ